jgi:signal transduction histidine kinase
LIVYGDGGIIYRHPILQQYMPAKNNLEIHDLFQKLNDMGTGLGSANLSTFVYREKLGIVIYTLQPRVTEGGMNRFKLYIIFMPMLLIFIFPAGVGLLLVIRLRKNLVLLERRTGQISSGDLHSEFTIPQSRILNSVFTAFEEMRRQIIENNAGKSRMLMAVSHDLKTPLTSIKAFLEALEDGIPGTEEERQR